MKTSTFKIATIVEIWVSLKKFLLSELTESEVKMFTNYFNNMALKPLHFAAYLFSTPLSKEVDTQLNLSASEKYQASNYFNENSNVNFMTTFLKNTFLRFFVRLRYIGKGMVEIILNIIRRSAK